MNISKHIFTIGLCCAMLLVSCAANNTGKNGNGAMNGDDQGYGGQGMATQLEGTIVSLNQQNGMLIIRNEGMDTIIVTDTTEIMMNGETKSLSDLNAGIMVSVWYEPQNGRKIATRINVNENGSASDQGYGGQGTGTELSGNISSYNPQDSMLIIVSNGRMDTVRVASATKIMMNGESMNAEDLDTGKMVTVWYEMQNGMKLATMISSGSANGGNNGNGTGNGCPSRGNGGAGYDTTDTGNGGSYDTTGTRRQ